MSETDLARPGADGLATYGIVMVGGARLALPLAALREIVPFPEKVERLPAGGPGLIGAMNLRRAVVPLLDLRAWFDGDQDVSSDVVVLIADGGRLIGIVGEGVEGIATVDPADRQAVTRVGDQKMLMSHAFQHPRTGDVVSVLDVEQVLSLPGIPVADEVIADGTSTTDAARERRRITLLRLGDHVVGVDVEKIHTTLPSGPLRPSLLEGGDCIGVIHHDDTEIPVLDPLSLLGLGRTDLDRSGPRAVLSLPHGRVVLQLTDVLRILELDADQVLPLPPLVMLRPDLFDGMALVEGIGQVFLVDGDALMAEDQVVTLAGLNTSLQASADEIPTLGVASGRDDADDPTAAGAGEVAVAHGEQYVLLRAGLEVAVPLEQVDEIIPWPDDLIDSQVGGTVLGVVIHRSATLPVLCLASLLGKPRASRGPETCVLIVRVDGVPTGFMVERLERIDRLSWSEPEPEPDADASDARGGRLLTLGDDTSLIPAVDLTALGRAAHAYAAA